MKTPIVKGREEGGRETCNSLAHFAWEGQEAASSLSQVLPHLFHGHDLCLQIHSQTVTSWLARAPTYKYKVWLTLYILKLVRYISNKLSSDLLQHRENIFLLLQVALVTQLIAWRCGQPIQVAQKPLQKAINENNFQNVFSVGCSMWAAASRGTGWGGCKQQCMRCTLHQVSGHWSTPIHSLIRPDIVLLGYSYPDWDVNTLQIV